MCAHQRNKTSICVAYGARIYHVCHWWSGTAWQVILTFFGRSSDMRTAFAKLTDITQSVS